MKSSVMHIPRVEGKGNIASLLRVEDRIKRSNTEIHWHKQSKKPYNHLKVRKIRDKQYIKAYKKWGKDLDKPAKFFGVHRKNIRINYRRLKLIAPVKPKPKKPDEKKSFDIRTLSKETYAQVIEALGKGLSVTKTAEKFKTPMHVIKGMQARAQTNGLLRL